MESHMFWKKIVTLVLRQAILSKSEWLNKWRFIHHRSLPDRWCVKVLLTLSLTTKLQYLDEKVHQMAS